MLPSCSSSSSPSPLALSLSPRWTSDNINGESLESPLSVDDLLYTSHIYQEELENASFLESFISILTSQTIPSKLGLRQHLTCALLHSSPLVNFFALLLLQGCCSVLSQVYVHLGRGPTEEEGEDQQREEQQEEEERGEERFRKRFIRERMFIKLYRMLQSSMREQLPDEKTILNCLRKLQQHFIYIPREELIREIHDEDEIEEKEDLDNQEYGWTLKGWHAAGLWCTDEALIREKLSKEIKGENVSQHKKKKKDCPSSLAACSEEEKKKSKSLSADEPHGTAGENEKEEEGENKIEGSLDEDDEDMDLHLAGIDDIVKDDEEEENEEEEDIKEKRTSSHTEGLRQSPHLSSSPSSLSMKTSLTQISPHEILRLCLDVVSPHLHRFSHHEGVEEEEQQDEPHGSHSSLPSVDPSFTPHIHDRLTGPSHRRQSGRALSKRNYSLTDDIHCPQQTLSPLRLSSPSSFNLLHPVSHHSNDEDDDAEEDRMMSSLDKSPNRSALNALSPLSLLHT